MEFHPAITLPPLIFPWKALSSGIPYSQVSLFRLVQKNAKIEGANAAAFRINANYMKTIESEGISNVI
ncbi:hypothetical protein DRW41_02840 [Neobacillus piezotolerans]|uniref:Uncharacterized protein n=1 Tax=Neobacillus piezotolerans TaxID=2259171 RepID=A0A3D8GVQ0_9BACI|nr:hypothetical protein DRW41_02840 [Neobacillus piezotolerans]